VPVVVSGGRLAQLAREMHADKQIETINIAANSFFITNTPFLKRAQ